MADVADIAEHNEAVLNAVRINAIRSQGRELLPSGYCHWCEEKFEAGSPKLFCDQHCAQDHEAHKRLRG